MSSFTILEMLEPLEPTPRDQKFFLARVAHQEHIFTAWIDKHPAIEQPVESLIGSSITAEIHYNKLLDWQIIADFQDEHSGIWSDQKGIHLCGRVHNLMPLADGENLIDIYLQNGPEFIAVTSSELAGHIPDLSAGIELIVEEITIYPYQI